MITPVKKQHQILHLLLPAVAFANLWAGGRFRELAIDLLRFSAAAPGGTMDALVTQIMLWGREQGYQWFSLGMAPLAGLEGRALAPPVINWVM